MDPRIEALFAQWRKQKGPGCVVAVRRDGRTIHERGYGVSDLELGVRITPATVFHIASLSKQFTGFLVLLLDAEGTLDLDDDIRTWVPEIPKGFPRITLRHLLHHTSGLRDHLTLMKLSGVRPMDERSEEDILRLLRRQRALNFRPGADFNYCNTGWVLLAAAVSRAIDAPFGDYLEERIFQPLGMTSSSVRDDHSELITHRARAYEKSERGLSYWVPNYHFVGATSVYTTAGDLLRWGDNLLAPRVGNAALVRRFMTSGRLNDGRPVRYGAGIEVGTYRGLKVVKHRGWDLGYSAHFALYPDEGLTIAIVGNVAPLSTEIFGRRIADVVLGDRRFPKKRPTVTKLGESVLAQKRGVYRHPATGRAHWITLEDGVLHLTPEPSMSGLALHPLSPTRFTAETEPVDVAFGRDSLTIREQTGVERRYTRVRRPWVPREDALAAFAGTYHSADLNEDLTFRLDGHELVALRRRWPERAVVPTYPDAFNDDIATYRFERNRAGRVVAVVLTLDRISHLRYVRRRQP